MADSKSGRTLEQYLVRSTAVQFTVAVTRICDRKVGETAVLLRTDPFLAPRVAFGNATYNDCRVREVNNTTQHTTTTTVATDDGASDSVMALTTLNSLMSALQRTMAKLVYLGRQVRLAEKTRSVNLTADEADVLRRRLEEIAEEVSAAVAKKDRMTRKIEDELLPSMLPERGTALFVMTLCPLPPPLTAVGPTADGCNSYYPRSKRLLQVIDD